MLNPYTLENPEMRREVRRLHRTLITLRRALPNDIRASRYILVWDDLSQWAGLDHEDSAVRWVSPAEVDLLARPDLPPERVASRFKRGAEAVVLEEEGQLVGIEWFGRAAENDADTWTEPFFEARPWLQMRLPRSVLWGRSAWVTPERRGQGVVGRMSRFAYPQLACRGFTGIMGPILWTNTSARRARDKGGYRVVGSIAYIRVGNFTVVRAGTSTHRGSWSRHKPLELAFETFVS